MPLTPARIAELKSFLASCEGADCLARLRKRLRKVFQELRDDGSEDATNLLLWILLNTDVGIYEFKMVYDTIAAIDLPRAALAITVISVTLGASLAITGYFEIFLTALTTR